MARTSTLVASADATSPEAMAIENPHSPLSGPHTRDGNGWID
ncbi:MAG: hypothetical protein RIB58_02845 [Phycisphaerales bacterium]